MEHKNMDYLSDEELMKMIQDTENQEMLTAPSYLKSEILTKISEAEQIVQIQEEKIIPIEKIKKPQNKKRALMIYRLKVAAVGAAAIFALFLMPIGSGRSEMPDHTEQNQASVTRTINERTNSFCNSLFEFSNGVIAPQDNKK